MCRRRPPSGAARAGTCDADEREAARVSGVAARFASGYLRRRASLAGKASTHAWAEV